MLLRKDILLSLSSSLLGEVYPAIRKVVFRYKMEEKYFLLRFYLDREPNKKDEETASVVLSEFISNFSHKEFEKIESECVFSNDLQNKLDVLDGQVYSRKEYFD